MQNSLPKFIPATIIVQWWISSKVLRVGDTQYSCLNGESQLKIEAQVISNPIK